MTGPLCTLPQLPRRFTPPQPRRDTPAPPPDIDFSTLDSAQKVSLLPSLNVANLFVLMSTIDQSSKNLQGFTATLQGTLGSSTPENLTYTLTDPTSPSLQVQGNIGTAAVAETWAVASDGSMTMNGTIGSAQEQLKWSPQSDGNHLDGTVGTLEVHCVAVPVPNDDGALTWDGTIGSSKFHIDQSMRTDDDFHPMIHVEGTLDSNSTELDAVFLDPDSSDGQSLNISGDGNIAGVNASYTQGVSYADPDGGKKRP